MPTVSEISSFSIAKPLILAEVSALRSSTNAGIEYMTDMTAALEDTIGSSYLPNLIGELQEDGFPLDNDAVQSLFAFAEIKKKLVYEYREIYTFEVTQGLISAAQTVGFSFAANAKFLYLQLDDGLVYVSEEEMKDFILKEFFTAAEVPLRDRTVALRDEIFENVFGWSERLTDEFI